MIFCDLLGGCWALLTGVEKCQDSFYQIFNEMVKIFIFKVTLTRTRWPAVFIFQNISYVTDVIWVCCRRNTSLHCSCNRHYGKYNCNNYVYKEEKTHFLQVISVMLLQLVFKRSVEIQFKKRCDLLNIILTDLRYISGTVSAWFQKIL